MFLRWPVHWVDFLYVANPRRSHLPRAASPTLEELLGRITTATPRFTLVTVNYDHPITPELRRQICSTPSIRMFYGQNLMKDGTKCNAKIQPLPLGLNTHKCVGLALLLFFSRFLSLSLSPPLSPPSPLPSFLM